jgi:hypothetical protein
MVPVLIDPYVEPWGILVYIDCIKSTYLVFLFPRCFRESAAPVHPDLEHWRIDIEVLAVPATCNRCQICNRIAADIPNKLQFPLYLVNKLQWKYSRETSSAIVTNGKLYLRSPIRLRGIVINKLSTGTTLLLPFKAQFFNKHKILNNVFW